METTMVERHGLPGHKHEVYARRSRMTPDRHPFRALLNWKMLELTNGR
jgi:hypothetical protein